MGIQFYMDSLILLDQTFDSFEELSHIAQRWDVDFRQLNAEQFKSDFFQAITGSILVTSAHLGCHVEQRGATPPGMRTFAVFDTNCSEVHWFGHIVSKDDLLLFPSNGEIDVFSRAGFGVTTFSISEDLLTEFFARNGIDNINKIINSKEIVKKTTSENINELRYLVRQLKDILQKKDSYTLNNQNPVDNVLLNEGLQNQILLSIFNIMTDSCDVHKNSSHDLSYNKRSQTLQLIIDYIKAHNDEQLHLETLYQVAQISERTLHYLFKNELGMTPKAYLKGQKMYNIHRELWSS
jgi:hypothetical protein